MIQKIKQQGIVLVTTLLTVVLVVMMVTAVVHSGTAGLALTTNFHDREVALMAAESGLQYATTRLQGAIGWKGGEAPQEIIAPNDLEVAENNGNVIGIVTSRLGQKSMFRIKFNFEDGDGGEDSRPNPTDKKFAIPSPFVSYNNIMGNMPIPAYRAKESGVGRSAQTPPYSIPKGTACIIVEGIAGPGLNDMELDDDSLLPQGYTVSRLVEGYYQIDSEGSVDSAAYAAGDINANLADGGRFTMSSELDDACPSLRSMKNVVIKSTNGSFVGNNGKIIYGSSNNDATHNCTFNGSKPEGVVTETQNSASKFKKLTWDDITKADPNNDANLPGGTYVWCIEGGENVLKYYPTVYPIGTEIPSNVEGTNVSSGTIIGDSDAIVVDSTNLGILINKNVYVPGKDGIVIRTSEELSSSRATIGFVPTADGELSSVLTTQGNIEVQGGVLGSGSITTEGSITFQGPSILESDPDTGVSIYAQGDVNLEEITNTLKGGKSAVKYAPQASITDAALSLVDSFPLIMGKGPYPGNYPPNPVNPYNPTPIPSDVPNVVNPDAPAKPEDIVITPADVENNSISNYADERLLSNDEATYLAKKKEQLAALVSERSKITYADQDITGVIYTWGNLNVNIGEKSFLHLTGTVIAYGGDPSSENPGEDPLKGGNININSANDVHLCYDPTYIKELLDLNSSFALKRTMWTSW